MDTVRRIADEMIEELRSSGTVPGIDVGDTAPDFVLPSATGDKVRLADRLAAGSVVVVFLPRRVVPALQHAPAGSPGDPR